MQATEEGKEEEEAVNGEEEPLPDHSFEEDDSEEHQKLY